MIELLDSTEEGITHKPTTVNQLFENRHLYFPYAGTSKYNLKSKNLYFGIRLHNYIKVTMFSRKEVHIMI